MPLDSFPDRSSLEQIRRDLWFGQEHGRASVMIGAGMSLNARPVSDSTRRFPTWIGLGAILGRELDPTAPSDTTGLSAADVMRLAYEFEVHFGSIRLAELLRREI